MNRIALAGIIAALGSAASAQQGNFSYSGEIVSIQDDLGIFTDSNLGDTVSGVFAFNPTGERFVDIPSFLIVTEGDSISADFANANYLANEPDSVVVLVANDLNSLEDPNPSDDSVLVDTLAIFGVLPDLDSNTYASVGVLFEGETTWFEGTSLPDITTFGLENLLRAEVVIEFQVAEGFDGDFNPVNPPDGITVTRSELRARITTIANNSGTIATIGCRAFQFAPPVAQRDFFDVTAFISAFSANDVQADLAAPAGVLNFADVAAFLGQYNSACSN